MQTLLQMTNKVLRRLREDTVTATTDNAYATLIAEFISDVQEEIVDAHMWSSMYSTAEITMVDATSSYTIPGTSSRSEIAFNEDQAPNLFYRRSGETDVSRMWLLAYPDFVTRDLLQRSADNAQPEYVSIRHTYALADDELTLYLDPIPTADQAGDVVLVQTWNPPVRLETDGTDDDTVLSVPDRTVFLGTVFYALNERGEEIGEPGNVAEQRYQKSLRDAITNDSQLKLRNDYYEFRAD
jgi:hypothetical protein